VPRSSGKYRIHTFIALVLAVTIIFFLVPPAFNAIRKLSVKTFAFTASVLSGTGGYFRSKSGLIDANRALNKKVNDLSLELIQIRELGRENARLRDLLGLGSRTGFNTVAAEVIGRNPNDWVDSFMINKGTFDGVQKGSAVCAAEGLLGRVVEAEEHTSSVMLITHPGFKAGGMIERTRVNGIVVGSGKGLLKMLYIPVDAEVPVGSTVITSGFSRLFPKGIVVGTVTRVEKSRTGLYKYAVITTAADSFSQEEVLCVK